MSRILIECRGILKNATAVKWSKTMRAAFYLSGSCKFIFHYFSTTGVYLISSPTLDFQLFTNDPAFCVWYIISIYHVPRKSWLRTETFNHRLCSIFGNRMSFVFPSRFANCDEQYYFGSAILIPAV